MSEETTVTVGLVCFEEREKLSLTLQSLKEQTAFHKIGEVLLIQNGKCERTLNHAKAFLSKLPLTILFNTANHIGRARAMIVNRAKFPLIAFTDSDCRVPQDWLEALLNHWESRIDLSPAGVGGPNRLPENKLWKKLFNLSLSHPLGHGWSPQAYRPGKPAPVSHLPTANALFSTAKLKEAGNFSLKCHPVGEDLDMGARLKAKGGDLYLFPDPVALNDCGSSYLQNLKRLFRFGEVKWKNKDRFLIPALLFAPGFPLSFGLGFIHPLYRAPLWIYLIVLVTGALQTGLKKPRTFLVFCLPLIWPLQHFAYSLGVVSGLFKIINSRLKS